MRRGNLGGGLKGREKILLHLTSIRVEAGDAIRAPFSLTQAGIAGAIKASQNSVSVALKRLVDEGHILISNAHVDGFNRKRRTYLLTPKGRSFAGEINEHLMN